MDYNLPGSSVHGVILTRILDWVAISSSRGIFLTQGSNSRPLQPCIGRWILYHHATWEANHKQCLTWKYQEGKGRGHFAEGFSYMRNEYVPGCNAPKALSWKEPIMWGEKMELLFRKAMEGVKALLESWSPINLHSPPLRCHKWTKLKITFSMQWHGKRSAIPIII